MLLELASAPQSIDGLALATTLELLEEVLAQGSVSPCFRLDTVRMQDRWERDFVTFCMSEMDKAAPFYPDPSIRGSVRTLPEERLAHHRGGIDSVLATLRKAAPSTYRA